MSQTAESNVSPAFRAVPPNPNLVAAGITQTKQDPTPPASQNVSTPLDTDSSATHAIPPAENPLPPQGVQQPPVVTTQQQTAPGAYQPDWAAIIAQQQRMQQMEAQNAELQRRLQEQDATIGNLMHMQQDYDDLKRQQQMQAELANIDYSDLTTVDAEDARRISASVMKALDAKLAPMQKQLAEQRQQIAQSVQHQDQRFAQQRSQDTLNRILQKHPDFLALQTDPTFHAYMQQRDGYSSQTLDDRATAEFKMGNAEYISHLVDQYKQTKPSTASISTVAPVQTAIAPVAPAGPAEVLPTLHELNSMMQMRQITPDEYRAQLAKIRAAQNNQG